MASISGRQVVAERGLVPVAVAALTPLMGDVGFEELGLVKALLRRFFSAEAWTAIDAAQLSKAVGPPASAEADHDEIIRHRLDDALTVVAGWIDGEFFIDIEFEPRGDVSGPDRALDLGRTFDYDVVPQPTPNPRALRFVTPRRDVPASASYRRGDDAGDDRVTAIFDVDPDIVDVLVAADFVAVSLSRPKRWPELLEPVLRAVATGFAVDGGGGADGHSTPPTLDVRAGGGAATPAAAASGRRTALERAWDDLGGLRADDESDFERILAASRDADGARRQVAAHLLAEAPPDVAASVWQELLDDQSRSVRRAALDAMVDAERHDLRPLLERALGDRDGWVRWKALHGLAVIGVGPSIERVRALTQDPDFRVRLEAENALRP